MYQKAVALWHALSVDEKAEWEALARPRHMTGFAWFMSQALKPNPGLYLPLQGGTMAGDIDMSKHRILRLPLPSDTQEPASKAYHDDVANLPTHGHAQHTNRTRTIELACDQGYVWAATYGLDIMPGWWADGDADGPRATFLLKVPDDFVSFTKVEAKWLCDKATGNMRWKLEAQYGAAGEVYNTHADTPAYGQTATGGNMIQNVQEPANPLTLVNLALGDNLGIKFSREGSHALDTMNWPTYLLAILFTYVADQ